MRGSRLRGNDGGLRGIVVVARQTHNGYLSAIWFARSDERRAQWGHTRGRGDAKSPPARERRGTEGLVAGVVKHVAGSGEGVHPAGWAALSLRPGCWQVTHVDHIV